jgi:hypothetical protein
MSLAGGASKRLIAVDHVGAVRIDIHLVFEDAVRRTTRREAYDEHAPPGNIHPDGLGLFDHRFTATGVVAGSSFALSACRRRLPTVEGPPGQPDRGAYRAWETYDSRGAASTSALPVCFCRRPGVQI